MTRAVPDINIWVSSILWRGNPYRIRKLGEKREVVLITSRFSPRSLGFCASTLTFL